MAKLMSYLIPDDKEPLVKLAMPEGAKVIGVIPYRGVIGRILALVEPGRTHVTRRFWVFAIGQEIPDGLDYVGSYEMLFGGPSLHIFTDGSEA